MFEHRDESWEALYVSGFGAGSPKDLCRCGSLMYISSFTGGFQRSSMVFGGFGFRFVISDLLSRRSSQSFRVLRGLLVYSACSPYFIGFSLSVDTGTWVSQLGFWSSVLGDYKCGDGSRESH